MAEITYAHLKKEDVEAVQALHVSGVLDSLRQPIQVFLRSKRSLESRQIVDSILTCNWYPTACV